MPESVVAFPSSWKAPLESSTPPPGLLNCAITGAVIMVKAKSVQQNSKKLVLLLKFIPFSPFLKFPVADATPRKNRLHRAQTLRNRSALPKQVSATWLSGSGSVGCSGTLEGCRELPELRHNDQLTHYRFLGL